jgi:hypothetical protein
MLRVMSNVIDLAAYRPRHATYAELDPEFRSWVDRAMMGLGLDPVEWQDEQLSLIAEAVLDAAYALIKQICDADYK